MKRWKTLQYYLDRVQRNIQLLDGSGIIKQTCEFARVYGIDFTSVLNRGSQFKVESVLSRITRPENFVMMSPSLSQVKNQRAPECVPLVMEPNSRFYNSPLLVLDFQSLYPSVMIAYNY
ncbi:DNA polymerase zeta, partial [Nowakowskiella sp. JEL0078]